MATLDVACATHRAAVTKLAPTVVLPFLEPDAPLVKTSIIWEEVRRTPRLSVRLDRRSTAAEG
jgi:hypothetical protein